MLPEKLPKHWRELLLRIPGYDAIATAEECRFDPKAAQLALDFFPECLHHVEGEMAGRPFVLEPWQQAVTANIFGWKKLDEKGRVVRRFREVLIYVGRKNGKALALDTPIPTPSGWTTMGAIREGDTVFAETGKPCRVLYVAKVQQGRPCYRVEFSDGESIVADAEHLWETRPLRTGRPGAGSWKGVPRAEWSNLPDKQVFTTEQIRATLIVNNPGKSEKGCTEYNHRIPVCGPLELPDVDLPIPPYVLGVWLGDGDSDSARITNGVDDNGLLDFVREAGVTATVQRVDPRSKARRVILGSTGRWGPGSLQSKLRAAGLLHNKHIPAGYHRASATQRMKLLRGLMDTDGYVSGAGQCEFTTISPQLRDDFLELARGLGFKPTVMTARATINGRDCGEKYRVQFWAFADRPVCLLPRKSRRLKPKPPRPTRSANRQIVGVRSVPSVPVRCIAVDSPSHLYLAGRGMIPTHNTPWMAGLALFVLFCDQESGQQNYIAAESREQAGKLFRHAKGMVLAEECLSNRCRIYGGNAQAGQAKSIVRLPEESSFVQIISADADSQHGGNTHLAIIDELHVQPNRELVTVLTSSTSSLNRKNPLVVYITTADFDRPSICNEKHDYACKVRDGVIKDRAFLPVIYEAAREDDWKLPATWAKANPNLGVSKSREYMERECKRALENPINENDFRRLDVNQKTEQAERIIPLDRWDACKQEIDRAALRGQRCFAGLDIGATSDFTALPLLFPHDDVEMLEVPVDPENPEAGSRPIRRCSYTLLPFFWLPERPVKRDPRMMAQIDLWTRQGLIRRTGEEVVDYDLVFDDIVKLSEEFVIEKIAVDYGFQGCAIARKLMDHFGQGTIEIFRQGIVSMAAPFRELLELIVAKRFIHDGNGVMRWMASNVAAERKAGLVKPSKDKSPEKIDGITGATMALGVALAAAPPAGRYYETHEVETW